ncbi:MAG: transporter permease [Bacteroidetes bacterium]|jgi:lipoprotein-releasing system permease protein|nr:transporter permease [Bacteroidota bacterium]
MNFSRYIAARILNQGRQKNNISSPIVKIGITGIALGVAVMIITMAVVTGFQQQIIQKITTFTSHLQINDYDPNQSLEPNPITFDQTLLEQIKATPNVKHIQSFATKNGILKTKTENEGIVLKGISSDYDWSYLEPYVTEGTVLSITNDSVSKDIFISQTLANKLHIKLNQKLLVYFMTKKKLADTTFNGKNYIDYEPRVKDFYVKGIFNTGFSDFDKNLVFVDLKQIQKLNYWKENEVAGYEVYLNDFELLEPSLETLNDVVGYNYTIASVKQLQSAIFSWLEMIDINAVIIITLMVLVAAINMISALLILILERTNLVGILKALGLANGNVRKIFFHVSLQLLIKGLFFGNLIGIGFCLLQSYFKFATLNPETYYLDAVPINFSIIHILLVNAGTILTCLLMMFLPTLILNKITPMKAIRFS